MSIFKLLYVNKVLVRVGNKIRLVENGVMIMEKEDVEKV